ncbi:NAD(P)/FAD-dependent oxidoreductase [Streptomyces sp. HD]|uniref:NAD(P)/FAD-dependent oxidoreductase n=1 Tax=Streptomyces sp. HD TaxID=3020892 RepID=UPI00232AA62A|nr:FAD-dependent oxidoreductase [Streptomyces sp. HD]MDC0773763.1 FAD-dependent oxidoreductase [Streptomyces sp. HD]
MKTIITTPSSDLAYSDFLHGGNVVHLPHLDTAPADEVLHHLTVHAARGLITSRRPPEHVLRSWSEHITGTTFLSYVTGTPGRSGIRDLVEFTQPDGTLPALAAALSGFERWFTLQRTVPLPPAPGPDGKDVVLVGAGIVNLITALYLWRAGHRVTVVDGAPAPGGDDWRRYGCTHAGDDARMFTFTEMDSYNNQDFHSGPPPYFRLPVDRKGWLATGDRPLSAEERGWVEEFERVPSWLARAYNQDVFAFTAEAFHEWTALRRDHPELFEDVVLTDDVLRLYADPDHRRSALARHRALGAVAREFTPDQLAAEFPALAHAFENGALAGGFLVPGFTVGIHRFTHRIVSFLRERGVVFHWDTPVRRVRRDGSGTVTGFDCGVPIPDDAHVVASPGVQGRALLAGSACEGRIHGVLGGWMRIGNERARLPYSLKVGRRRHVTEDANVTVAVDGDGRPTLIVGSGYGYTGAGTDADEAQLDAIRLGIMDTVERLFPDQSHPTASSRAGDNYDFKYCVRPWTATSLGIYHAETTVQGRLFVINGGHNTGGFAQAPAIARAVLASLGGQPHPMHALYHPERFTAFMPEGAPVATAPRAPAASSI